MRAEIYIDCPVCFCLIKSVNRDAHATFMHGEEFEELGIAVEYKHCRHCEVGEDGKTCISDTHFSPCPFDLCIKGKTPL